MSTPIEHVSREFAAFIRGPVGWNTYNFTSSSSPSASYRAGVFHTPRISAFPEPQDNEPDTFGVVANGTYTIEIADESTDDDWPLFDLAGNVLNDLSGAQLVQDY